MRVCRHVLAPIAAAALCLTFTALPAAARLLIEIDKSTQRMTVAQDGVPLYRWPVSTGAPDYATPSGSFTPFRMEKDHFSKEWDDAPMPNSIFFTKVGHAIHGTNHLSGIGRPVSHGCVRLEPKNARLLFALVKHEGMANTRVVLSGATPAAVAPAVARRTPQYDTQPMSIDPRDNEGDGGYSTPQERGYPRDQSADRGYRDGPRTGYWMRNPDGSQVFVDSESDPRGFPPPFFFPLPPPPFGRF
jgi:hypothetical protein